MKKTYFIIIFIFLFIISVIAIFNSDQFVEAFNDPNKDKIKTIVQDIAKETSKKTGKIASIVVDKAKEVAGSTYEVIKEEGGKAVGATIVEPTMGVVKDLVKKALSSASSLLTDDDIEEILLKNENNNCNCK